MLIRLRMMALGNRPERNHTSVVCVTNFKFGGTFEDTRSR